MADFSAAARFFGIKRTRVSDDDADAADLGTAFGLDLSLDEASGDEGDQATRPARGGWLRLLGTRGNTEGS